MKVLTPGSKDNNPSIQCGEEWADDEDEDEEEEEKEEEEILAVDGGWLGTTKRGAWFSLFTSSGIGMHK